MPEALYAPLPIGKACTKTSEWEDAKTRRQSFNGWRIGYDDCDMDLFTADQMRAYADATCSLRGGQQGWRPIEEAPKDGSEVWAFNGEQGRMNWTEGHIDELDQWALWVWADPGLAEIDPSPDQPTHWMPLPEAPTSTHTQETQP